MAQSMRRTEIYPITVRELEVLRVQDVTPGMRRVTLGGEGLGAHTAPNGMPVHAFRSDGFDDEFKLFLTHPSLAEPLRPEQADGTVIWPRDERLVPRTYTVRRWDPLAGELDVDFVVHGVGMATTWARRATAGQRIPIAGPKSSSSHPLGADWTLVAGDETALPAIGRWLEEWPEGERGKVFVEVAEDSHRQDLTVPEGVELTWLSREGAEPGTTTLLLDAITGTEWWPGKAFAWVAGEATTLTPIRRWLRNEKGLGREQLDVTGYWKCKPAEASAEDPELPRDEAGEDLHERLESLAGILPAFAVRTAVTLGIPDALADEPLTAAALAGAVGVPVAGLERLLPYLVTQDVLRAEQAPVRYELTELGRELQDDYVHDVLDLNGYEAWREITAGLSLIAAVRGGAHARSARARSSEELASRPDLVDARSSDAEEFADFYGATLAGMLPLASARRLAVAGPAAGALAELFVRENPDLRVSILGRPEQLASVRRRHGENPRIEHAPLPGVEGDAAVGGAGGGEYDVAILAMELGQWPDPQARALLGALRPSRGLFVMDEVLDPVGVEEHDLEHNLLDFALTGGGVRTDGQFRELLHESGHEVVARENVGWSGQLYETRLAEHTTASP
ncbi:siderophore-interacting protein [Kocuria sp.]|uniref:siderophore-interacting protein n=1 Tax=Kocuria sp. TaxID=1871328 RepID=UPI0026DC9569|nr:siderophore-interacting protein [Kocuria sp.]MDO4920147.1 siderophore-interacting protein [Kocuria sp.]